MFVFIRDENDQSSDVMLIDLSEIDLEPSEGLVDESR